MSTAQVIPADDAAIRRAAELIRAGGLVAFPTETVYGLGANALDAAAVRRIFAAKGRPPNNPLIVHVAHAAAALTVAADLSEIATRLAAHFWPGPLTLVLPKRPELPAEVTASGPTVAVRVPNHPVALALLRESGVPIAAPSANRSTAISPTTAQHVARALGDAVDLILDSGPCPGGIESTVLDVTASPPRLLRPGQVTPADLSPFVSTLYQPEAPVTGDRSPPRSPGQSSKHYAPRTPLELVPGDVSERMRELEAAGLRVGRLTWEGSSPAAFAARLYAHLHELDAAGYDRIVVAEPPDTPEWLAVRDRLRRAAAIV